MHFFLSEGVDFIIYISEGRITRRFSSHWKQNLFLNFFISITFIRFKYAYFCVKDLKKTLIGEQGVMWKHHKLYTENPCPEWIKMDKCTMPASIIVFLENAKLKSLTSLSTSELKISSIENMEICTYTTDENYELLINIHRILSEYPVHVMKHTRVCHWMVNKSCCSEVLIQAYV